MFPDQNLKKFTNTLKIPRFTWELCSYIIHYLVVQVQLEDLKNRRLYPPPETLRSSHRLRLVITKIGRAFPLKVLQGKTLRKHDGCFFRPSPALRGILRRQSHSTAGLPQQYRPDRSNEHSTRTRKFRFFYNKSGYK